MESVMPKVSCPALFLSAPASGQGKTTICAALARMLRRQGKVVRVFKTGPDYLDPQILEQASGQPELGWARSESSSLVRAIRLRQYHRQKKGGSDARILLCL